MLVPGDVAVALGVHPAGLALALAVVVEALLVGPAVLGGVGQTVGHGALLHRLKEVYDDILFIQVSIFLCTDYSIYFSKYLEQSR